MNILIIEPFFSGSHAQWAREIQKFSRHKVSMLTMPGRNWKWRMHGGSVTLAREFLESDHVPDLILATDMLDLAGFMGLTRKKLGNTPVAIYFHENQLTYPWSPNDRDRRKNRDRHYCFINIQSALAADRVLFNSHFHMRSFLGAIPGFLNAFPDYNEEGAVDRIREKSSVLSLGMDLARFDGMCPGDVSQDSGKDSRLLLWNHRWEYDKNPGEFFDVMYTLEKKGTDFALAILGEESGSVHPAFTKAKETLKHRIRQFGYASSFDEYARWLWKAGILPVTSNQDFFGISIMEAMYCRCVPLLPRRLTYPELIPEGKFPHIFYDSADELVEKLERFIVSGPPYEGNSFRRLARQYDWSIMIDIYDEVFERLASF
jgi:glycosyltransferase involved in cell wall biosynthesis